MRRTIIKQLLEDDFAPTIIKYDYFFEGKVQFEITNNFVPENIISMGDGRLAYKDQQGIARVMDLNTQFFIFLTDKDKRIPLNLFTLLPDGRIIGFKERSFYIWNTDNLSRVQHTNFNITSPVYGVYILSNDYFVTISNKQHLQKWDLKGKCVFEYTSQISAIGSLSNGNIILGLIDGTIILPETQTFLIGHTDAVTHILGSKKIVTASKDGTFRIWNSHTGICESVDRAYVKEIFIPTDETRIMIMSDYSIEAWDFDGAWLGALKNHADKILDIDALPNNDIISISMDRTMWVSNLNVSFNIATYDNSYITVCGDKVVINYMDRLTILA